MTFKRHSEAEARRRSAIILAKAVLHIPGLHEAHRRECLSLALWKLTEAESVNKHETRYQSAGGRSAPRGQRRHDHVFQRARMIADLMAAAADPVKVDTILEKAVACTVSIDEHCYLDQFKYLDGWDRYKKAGLFIFDTERDEQLDLDSLINPPMPIQVTRESN